MHLNSLGTYYLQREEVEEKNLNAREKMSLSEDIFI